MATAKKDAVKNDSAKISEINKKIDAIIKQIKELETKRDELVKERYLLLGNVKTVPLNQLNMITRYGAEEAKKKLGASWVE